MTENCERSKVDGNFKGREIIDFSIFSPCLGKSIFIQLHIKQFRWIGVQNSSHELLWCAHVLLVYSFYSVVLMALLHQNRYNICSNNMNCFQQMQVSQHILSRSCSSVFEVFSFVLRRKYSYEVKINHACIKFLTRKLKLFGKNSNIFKLIWMYSSLRTIFTLDLMNMKNVSSPILSTKLKRSYIKIC